MFVKKHCWVRLEKNRTKSFQKRPAKWVHYLAQKPASTGWSPIVWLHCFGGVFGGRFLDRFWGPRVLEPAKRFPWNVCAVGYFGSHLGGTDIGVAIPVRLFCVAPRPQGDVREGGLNGRRVCVTRPRDGPHIIRAQGWHAQIDKVKSSL